MASILDRLTRRFGGSGHLKGADSGSSQTSVTRPTRKDMIAATTGAVAGVPDGMADAMLVGINPVHGIYTQIVTMPVAAATASTKLMVVATTSAVSITAVDALGDLSGEERLQALVVITLLSGIVQLALGLLKLGQVTKFISNSVMTGFLTGVAVVIVLGQLGDLTGYYSDEDTRLTKTWDLLTNITEVDPQTTAIGVGSILLMLAMNRTRLSQFGLLIGLGVAAIVTALFNWGDVPLVSSLAEIPRSLPSFAVPELRYVPSMLLGSVAVAVVGLIQAAGVAQRYTNPDKSPQDDSRDFTAQGVANIAGAFFRAMPGGGSLSATALNASAGAQTRWALIVRAAFVIVIVLIFSDLLGTIPVAALAAVLIYSASMSIKFAAIRTVQETSLTSNATMLITFIATLVIPLQQAVILGVLLAVVIFLYQSGSDIRVVEMRYDGDRVEERTPPAVLPDDDAIVLDVYGSLFFAGSNSLASLLPDAVSARRAYVILSLRGHENDVGSSFIKVITDYGNEIRANGGHLALTGVNPAVRDRLERTGVAGDLADRIYDATTFVGESSRQALADARIWLSTSAPAEGQGVVPAS